jgi:hypothetical protein
MNVLRSLAGTNWRADQGMLLRIHEMFIFSALEYGSIAYRPATDGQMKRLRIALGVSVSVYAKQQTYCVSRNMKISQKEEEEN